MKTRIYLFALMLMLSSIATTSQAAMKSMTKEQTEVRVSEMRQRVEEIKTTDFSKLSTAERKDIKNELRGMNKEMRSMDPIIIISGGALILIIILLILLL